MITVYTVTYNEEIIIQFMIDHYRKRFPNCHIIVYDNMSTDKTVEIALANNCAVIPYFSNNQLQDSTFLKIKNNCWKHAKTDWVLVCDIDELLDINEEDLKSEESLGSTMIRSEAYNMVNMQDNLDLTGINHGVRCPLYDKLCLFNRKFIININYNIGCHICNPKGQPVISNKAYHLYHYKYINLNCLISRYTVFLSRLSESNKKNKWGLQYLLTPEQIHDEFIACQKQAVKLF